MTRIFRGLKYFFSVAGLRYKDLKVFRNWDFELNLSRIVCCKYNIENVKKETKIALMPIAIKVVEVEKISKHVLIGMYIYIYIFMLKTLHFFVFIYNYAFYAEQYLNFLRN